MKSVYYFLSSLRLTVTLLAISIVLVFFGTLDQVHWGIHQAQKLYFESFFVLWPHRPDGYSFSQLGLPLLGGYSVGILLLINLILGFFRFMKVSWKKSGIMLIHSGIILLLVSGFMISAWQKESQMRINEGEKSNFSSDIMSHEIVLIDKSKPDTDRVTSLPHALLKEGETFNTPDGITIEIIDLMSNSFIGRQTDTSMPPQASHGAAAKMKLIAEDRPLVFDTKQSNVASAVVKVSAEGETMGTWLISSWLDNSLNLLNARIPPQQFEHNGKRYEIAMRFSRTYYPFSIELLDFTHDRYPGTNIPKNFSSQVNVINTETHETRQALIYMNHPLRYAGLTFFQSGFDNDDTTTILQIVRNPVWRLPYWAVLLVGLGMLVQFIISLIHFSAKTRARAATPSIRNGAVKSNLSNAQ